MNNKETRMTFNFESDNVSNVSAAITFDEKIHDFGDDE